MTYADSELDPAATHRLRIGIVGLGMIGAGVATSLRTSQWPATAVYDVRAEVTAEHAATSTVAESPAALAAAVDLVLVAVNTAKQARTVLTGDDGLLAGAREGTVVALLSTVDLATVRRLAERCAAHGVTLLDAGVTGGPVAAENGLVTMVGGPDDVVERVRPALEAFSRNVVHCGPLGAGMATKLARNATTYAFWAAVREATSIAAAAGVEPAKLLEVMQTADGSVDPTLHLSLLAADYRIPEEQAEWAIGLADKDLDGFQELAAEVGVEAPIADLTRARMPAVYGGELETPLPPPDAEGRARGRAMMDRVYGPGYSNAVDDRHADAIPAIAGTIDYLFPQVWSRPYLTVRDRRLLTIGLTSLLGRADLLEVQLRGALLAGDLTVPQLRELAAHLHPYAGWGNGSVLLEVTERLAAEVGAKRTEARPAP